MRLTRRAILQGAGALTAAALVPGCGDPGALTALVLEVEATRALIAVWSPSARSVDVVVGTAAGAGAAAATVALDAHGHGALDVTELGPDTAYRVRVLAPDGGEHGPLAFVTAPVETEPRPLRLMVSADVDEDGAYASPIFDTIAAAPPDLFVALGDWPYADNGPSATTRAGYEAKYARGRLEPRFAPWMAATSFRAIYDDHEFANDWDGAARAADPARHAAALAAWDAWFPRRGDGPRYRRWRWGALCECFLLDCRNYRSANDAPDGPAKTMLGAVQRRWLVDGLRASTAPFKLVFSSVPLDFGNADDHWAAFADERDAILGELAAARLAGMLWLSADQHWFAAHQHRDRVREFQVGPLSRGLLTPPPPRPGVLTRVHEYNVGLIEITAAPRLRFRALGATGATLYDEAFTPADLALEPGVPWPPLP